MTNWKIRIVKVKNRQTELFLVNRRLMFKMSGFDK
jgi:hypothetical protein